MRLDATQLLARYQRQIDATRRPPAAPPAPPPKVRASSTPASPAAAEPRPQVNDAERAFIDRLLSSADGESLPASVAELAKGRNVDLKA